MGYNVLIVYEVGIDHIETRLFFVNVDKEERTMIRKCHGRYLAGAGNHVDEEDCLKWLDTEITKGKFKDCRIRSNQIVTLESCDVPVTVVVTGHAL